MKLDLAQQNHCGTGCHQSQITSLPTSEHLRHAGLDYRGAFEPNFLTQRITMMQPQELWVVCLCFVWFLAFLFLSLFYSCQYQQG